jgi:hypothetical protein
MKRRRAVITVRVDLDPVPGTFHNAEDHVKHIQRMLNDAYPHYHPKVTLDFVNEPVEYPNRCCTLPCDPAHCIKNAPPNTVYVHHYFDSGYTGMSTACNYLVLDDTGAATTCGLPREAHRIPTETIL